MPESRFYREGYKAGWGFYAPRHTILNAYGKLIRNMTPDESAEYDRGYKTGKGKVDGARLVQLGYDRD